MIDKMRASVSIACFCACALSAPLRAEDAATEDEIHGEWVVGDQYYAATDNRDSAKFQEFRDVPNGFVAERFALSWTPKARAYFDLDAVDIGQDDQRLNVEFGRTDVWRGTVRWVENPRRWTDSAVSLFGQSGDLFTLEDSFQSAVRTAAASTLPAGDADSNGEWDPGTKGFVIENAILSSATPVSVGHQRKQGTLAFEYTPTRHWTFGIAGDRERRQGTAPQSLGMYFALAPAEVAAPLDFRTDTGTASAEYASKRFDVAVGLSTSRFETGHKSLTWDDQLFLVDEAVNVNTANPGHGRMTLGVDNRMQRLSARAGVNLPGHTRLDASFASGKTTQDDAFLPMTVNSLLVASPLPAASFDGEYRTQMAQLRVTSRPTRLLRWDAWWRSYEVDNRSPELTFLDTVNTDYQFPLCGNVNLPCDANGNDVLDDRLPRRNLPYGYKREAAGAKVGLRPVGWFQGSLSYEQEEMKREFSAVTDSTEDDTRLRLDFDADWITLRTTLRRQERRADGYDAQYLEESFPNGEPNVAAANEGSRRFYWTDRDRDSLMVQVEVSPDERWSIYAETTRYSDDYFDPETGLPIGSTFQITEDRNFDTIDETYDILLAGRTDAKGTSQSLGVAYSAGPRFDVFADYTAEDFEYALASRYRNVTSGVGTDNPLDDWSSRVDDEYGTGSLGFQAALSADRSWTLRGDLSRSRGTGLIRTDFVPGGAASGDTTLTVFPRLSTTLKLATLTLNRAARKNLDYSLRYWYESWKEDNFAQDQNGPYMGDPTNDPSMAHAVFLGLDFRNYTNHIVSLLMRYRY
jgi:MtrB/PioB family decaheme-associated outer membrane protein